MSNAIKEKIYELKDYPIEDRPKIFRTNKDKLVELLLNEITFLDTCYYKTDILEVREQVCLALEVFENLLKLQKYTEAHLTEDHLTQMRAFIYQTINRISKKIVEVEAEQ